MRLGCCVPLASFVPQIGGEDIDAVTRYRAQVEKVPQMLAALDAAGFDFCEFGVGLTVPEWPEDEFKHFASAVRGARPPVEAYNSFIPPDIKVCGQSVDAERLQRYVASACSRVAATGAEVIVFGSGGARSAPDDFPLDEARRQVRDFLQMAADEAQRNAIVICIEPLNANETNMINYVSEAAELAREVGRPQVRALADTYHMFAGGESFANLLNAGSLLAHVHLADSDRRIPGDGDLDWPAFFSQLKRSGYDGRLSLECRFDDFEQDTRRAAEFVRLHVKRGE